MEIGVGKGKNSMTAVRTSNSVQSVRYPAISNRDSSGGLGSEEGAHYARQESQRKQSHYGAGDGSRMRQSCAGNTAAANIMKPMTPSDGLAATRHARRHTVTASIDRQLDFLSPVYVGDFLTLYVSVNSCRQKIHGSGRPG